MCLVIRIFTPPRSAAPSAPPRLAGHSPAIHAASHFPLPWRLAFAFAEAVRAGTDARNISYVYRLTFHPVLRPRPWQWQVRRPLDAEMRAPPLRCLAAPVPAGG